jgi:hypothetical protein
VFALQACLQVGDFSFFGVGIGLASLVVSSEGGGAVLLAKALLRGWEPS